MCAQAEDLLANKNKEEANIPHSQIAHLVSQYEGRLTSRSLLSIQKMTEKVRMLTQVKVTNHASFFSSSESGDESLGCKGGMPVSVSYS